MRPWSYYISSKCSQLWLIRAGAKLWNRMHLKVSAVGWQAQRSAAPPPAVTAKHLCSLSQQWKTGSCLSVWYPRSALKMTSESCSLRLDRLKNAGYWGDLMGWAEVGTLVTFKVPLVPLKVFILNLELFLIGSMETSDLQLPWMILSRWRGLSMVLCF